MDFFFYRTVWAQKGMGAIQKRNWAILFKFSQVMQR